MSYTFEKLNGLLKKYLDEAQLADDEDQIIVLCSIMDEVEGFGKKLKKQVELYEKGLSPKHDVCCVLCLEKGEIMTVKKILGSERGRHTT